MKAGQTADVINRFLPFPFSFCPAEAAAAAFAVAPPKGFGPAWRSRSPGWPDCAIYRESCDFWIGFAIGFLMRLAWLSVAILNVKKVRLLRLFKFGTFYVVITIKFQFSKLHGYWTWNALETWTFKMGELHKCVVVGGTHIGTNFCTPLWCMNQNCLLVSARVSLYTQPIYCSAKGTLHWCYILLQWISCVWSETRAELQ